MSDRENPTEEKAEDSAEERRSRQSAREVAEWEAAFASAKAHGSPARAANVDRANAGAMVSRAHRAEKTTVRPSQP